MSRALVQEHEENERAEFCRLLGLALELLTGKDGFLPYVDRLAGTDKQSGNLVDDGEADDVSPAGSAQGAGTPPAYGALGSLWPAIL